MSMYSKESIRKQILTYAELLWGRKITNQSDIMVRLLVEELTEELFLMRNSLENIGQTLLEKLAVKLTPPQYLSVRPAHTVLRMKTSDPQYILSHKTPFYLKHLPDSLKNKDIENIIFYPLTDTNLFNIDIDYVVHSSDLFTVSSDNTKQIKDKAKIKDKTNSIWLGLNINPEIKNLKGLTFYIDFPDLSEIHDYYEVICYTELIINGKSVKLKQGFPESNQSKNSFKADILAFYKKNYFTIDEDVLIKSLPKELLPVGYVDNFDAEKLQDIVPSVWIQLKFQFSILYEDLQKITINLNTFPAYNARFYNQKAERENLECPLSLGADNFEKLLDIISVSDSNNTFTPYSFEETEPIGVYRLKPITNFHIQGLEIADYLEQLSDLVENERIAFPEIDPDKINDIIHAITSVETDKEGKMEINKKDNQKLEIGKMLIYPYPATDTVNIDYLVTYGELANGISAGERYVPQLDGQSNMPDAISLKPVCGGKEFSHMEDLLAINKYLLLSNDRLVTENNITSFCEMELGKLVEKVELKLTTKISSLPHEGIIKTIEVRLYPSDRYPGHLYNPGVLRHLLNGLNKRSPRDHNYTIKVMTESAN